MVGFSPEQITQTRALFDSRGYQTVEAGHEGTIFHYYVLPQSLEPDLPDFAFRMTPADPHREGSESIFGVSESVPEALRPWWALHEYLEFVQIGEDQPGRCAQAEEAVLALIPPELKVPYIARRYAFFQALIPYFQAKSYPAEFSTEATGTIELLSQALGRELATQLSEVPVTCTACSLVNTLRVSGALISAETSQELMQRIIEEEKPLSDEQKQAFAAAYGFAIGSPLLPSEESLQTFPQALDIIMRYLQANSPVLLNISTYISKRDPNIKALITFGPEKNRVHSVVAASYGNVVMIIDPYDPSRPEIFFMKREEEQKRLLAWIFSVMRQDFFQSDRSATAQIILQKNLEQIEAHKNDFSDLAFYGLLRAQMRSLTRK